MAGALAGKHRDPKDSQVATRAPTAHGSQDSEAAEQRTQPAQIQQVPPGSSHSGLIDPCNLFCKNLDPEIDSNGLFSHFRRFGQIVSTRVMRNDVGESRGFGFVSFQKPEHANTALAAMNGAVLGSKAIVVRLHEPKQFRQEKLAARYQDSGHPRSAAGANSPNLSVDGGSSSGGGNGNSPLHVSSPLASPHSGNGTFQERHIRRASGRYYASPTGTLSVLLDHDGLASLNPISVPQASQTSGVSSEPATSTLTDSNPKSTTPNISGVKREDSKEETLSDPNTIQSATQLQHWLDHNGTHPCRQAQIRRYDHLVRHEGKLPDDLFIQDVTITNRNAVAGGAFADVFLGKYRGQDVAVKRFRSFGDDKKKLYRRFCREALLWRQLRHRHILPMLGVYDDAIQSESNLAMISPWMAQGTLMVYLNKAGSTPVFHIQLIKDMASGLEYLHSQTIAHGDLHGSNIYIDEYGRAVLGDFGLTAITDIAYLSTTTTINKAGASRWLAPEFLYPDQDAGSPPRKTMSGDIFALGRLCLSIYTRRRPFHAIGSDMMVITMIMIDYQNPSKPTADECHGTEIQEQLWNLILRCWNREAAARPSITDVQTSLGSL